MTRSGVMFYFSNCRMLALLDDAQCGRLFRAVMAYAEHGEEPCSLDKYERLAFEAMREAVDRDGVRYAKKCAQLKENARRGGRPRKGEQEALPQASHPAGEPGAAGCAPQDGSEGRAHHGQNQIEAEKTKSKATPTPTATPIPTPISTPASSSSLTGAAGQGKPRPEGAPTPGTLTTTTTMQGDPTDFGGTGADTAEQAGALEGALECFWAANFGKRLTPHQRARLAGYRGKGCEAGLLQLAMQRAVEQDKPTLAYVTAILDNALACGAHTADEYRKRSGPHWRAPAGSPAAKSGENAPLIKNLFQRDWMAELEDEPAAG